MDAYVDAARRHVADRLPRMLDAIVANPRLHSRFLNTLARLEYVGVRKMLKARQAERLDLAGLEHMLDEAVHALRLKKAALAVASETGGVATFSDADTLAGDAGETYFQALDKRAEEVLQDRPDADRAEANYLLTSAVIEVRAQAFYPLYEDCLKARGAKVSVSAILKDESRHLAEMAASLQGRLPDWRPRIEAVLDSELALFSVFMDALERSIASA